MDVCSILSQAELVPAGIEAYRALERFHYRDGAPGPWCAIYAMVVPCQKRDAIAGVIVYGPAAMNNAARDAATSGYFAGHSKVDKLALLNAHVRRISRVIVEPRWRGLGLGVRLVRETLALVGAAMVETTAAMGHVHPLFERAGMRPYAPRNDTTREQLRHALTAAAIDESLWADPSAVQARLDALTGPLRDRIEEAMRLFLNRFGRRRTMNPGLERTAYLLTRLSAAPMYYAWLNPDRPVPGLRLV